MNVFIDTNILLSFYHFTDDDLDALNSVFVSSGQGDVTVHLTDQVRDEFRRNRESKIHDALKRFKGLNLSVQLPNFMKTYEEYERLQRISKLFRSKHASILKKAEEDIRTQSLAADHLIEEIFEKFKVLETTTDIYNQAKQRIDVGNPPGKGGSLGDAINWLLLLDHVPKGKSLFMITDDADFYTLEGAEMSPFLREEWKRKKKAEVRCYKNLKAFFKEHYDGVGFSFDPEKKALIDELENAGSFAGTHGVVSQLGAFRYFSLEEAKGILEACISNNQVNWIVTDDDVARLIRRVVSPHVDQLKDKRYKEIIDSVGQE